MDTHFPDFTDSRHRESGVRMGSPRRQDHVIAAAFAQE